MTPPTVNAYYEPTMNEMVFPGRHPPAAVLCASTRRPALNFGAIGMVVGHELTHGFDDEGRQFDADGQPARLVDAAPSARSSTSARACVEQQFDDYVAVDDVHIKGKLTLGENIADLGGLKLSFAAFQRAEKDASERPRPLGRLHAASSSSSSASRRRGARTIRPEALRAAAPRPTRTRRPSGA